MHAMDRALSFSGQDWRFLVNPFGLTIISMNESVPPAGPDELVGCQPLSKRRQLETKGTSTAVNRWFPRIGGDSDMTGDLSQS